MRGVGGIAGNYFTAFFLLIAMYAIFQGIYPSIETVSEAIFWGVLSIMFVDTGFLCIFLAGEYAASDRPRPWRISSLGIGYGIVWCFLFITLISPPGEGLLFITFVPGFGWVLNATPLFFWSNTFFGIGSFGFFLRFCISAYRIAPVSHFGTNVKRLLVTLVYVCLIAGGGISGAWYFTDFATDIPSITMIRMSLCMIYSFFLLDKEFRLMYLLPQKTTCLFVLNTSGIVYYSHMFQTEDPVASVGLFAPALAAVNFIVQESLELKEDDWIQEFHTDERTFLLDVRSDIELMGVLLVSRPTQMLRKAFARFMDELTPIWKSNNNQLILTPEEKEKVKQIIAKAFLFIPDKISAFDIVLLDEKK